MKSIKLLKNRRCRILTGCYDNTVNIWTVSGKHQVGAREHTHLIRSVAWLKHDDPSGGFVSVSHDLTGFLWKWDPGTEEVVSSIFCTKRV